MALNIIDLIQQVPNDNSIYLIHKLTESTGFFCLNGKLIYIVKNLESLKFESIDTEYISLKTNVNIVAVVNHPQFENGNYNLVMFKGEIIDTNIDAFIRLCEFHSHNINEIGFVHFFYSLVNLFQLPKEQHYKNLIGLYGELKFIEMVYNTYNLNIANKWHQNDNDKYDFVCSNSNFEVKTTTNDERVVTIKHSQIFNDDNNYLVIVQLENNNAGESLNSLIDRLQNINDLSQNYYFQLNIEKERSRISKSDAESKLLKLIEINLYNKDSIPTLVNIPDCISDLTYKYNCEGLKEDQAVADLFE